MGEQHRPEEGRIVPPAPNPRFKHPRPFRTAVLPPDGSTLAGLDVDGILVAWDARTAVRRYRRKVLETRDLPHRLTCSPDGRHVAVSLRDHGLSAVRVFRLDSGDEVRRFDRGFSPCFSPDGDILICTEGSRIRRWSLKSGAELPSLPETGDDLKWTALSPQGDRLAASFADSSTVAVWDLPSRSWQLLAGGEGALTQATSLAFSPDGSTLAVGNSWGIRFKSLNGAAAPALNGHEEYSNGALRFTPDGRRMVAVSQHRRLLYWDLATGIPRFTWSAFNTAEGLLEVSEACDQVIWFDSNGLRLERFPSLLGGETDAPAIVDIGFMPDGQAITGDAKGVFRVWDPATRKEVRRFEAPVEQLRLFSRDGRWGVFVAETDQVRIWDLFKGRELLNISTAPYVKSMAVSPDGATLALGHGDGSLSLWSIAEKKERARIQGDLAGVGAVCWSDDGKALAWGDDLGAVVMAEGSAGREVVRFAPRRPWAIRELQFLEDGKTLAASNVSGDCFLYDGMLGKEPRKADREEAFRYRGLLYDRRWVASGFRQSLDGSAVFSPEGTYALTRTGGKALLWEAPGEK